MSEPTMLHLPARLFRWHPCEVCGRKGAERVIIAASAGATVQRVVCLHPAPCRLIAFRRMQRAATRTMLDRGMAPALQSGSLRRTGPILRPDLEP